MPTLWRSLFYQMHLPETGPFVIIWLDFIPPESYNEVISDCNHMMTPEILLYYKSVGEC